MSFKRKTKQKMSFKKWLSPHPRRLPDKIKSCPAVYAKSKSAIQPRKKYKCMKLYWLGKNGVSSADGLIVGIPTNMDWNTKEMNKYSNIPLNIWNKNQYSYTVILDPARIDDIKMIEGIFNVRRTLKVIYVRIPENAVNVFCFPIISYIPFSFSFECPDVFVDIFPSSSSCLTKL